MAFADRRVALTGIASSLLLMLFVPNIGWAQNSSTSAETNTDAEFSTSYKTEVTGIGKPLTLSTQNHVYHQGDRVRAEGAVWIELIEQVDAISLVKVEMKDGSGNVVAREDASVDKSNGSYATSLRLQDTAGKGVYTLESRIELEADALGIVETVTSAALQSSVQFVVAQPADYNVNAENQNFTVSIATNSGVNAFEFKQQEKKISFFIEGDSGTVGVTEITIPKTLLSGEMTILMDQNVVDNDNVLLKSETTSEATYEINYHHSIHRMEITGTSVVPEFPLSIIALATAVGSIVALSIAMKWQNFLGSTTLK